MNPKDRIGITKVPLDLCPLPGLVHESLALLDGACKYGKHNWRGEEIHASVYVGACLRHLMKWANGRNADPDSGVHELGHAKACLAILLDAEATGNLIDDRSKQPNVSNILDKCGDTAKAILARYPDKVDNG